MLIFKIIKPVTIILNKFRIFSIIEHSATGFLYGSLNFEATAYLPYHLSSGRVPASHVSGTVINFVITMP